MAALVAKITLVAKVIFSDPRHKNVGKFGNQSNRK